MMKSEWVVIALIFVIGLLYVISSKSIDGFQPTAPNAAVSIKDEVCQILRDLHRSVKMKYDNFDQTKLDNKSILETHLKGIKDQLVKQGCE